MEYFVYILYSPSLNSFYKGHTQNLEERLFRHNHQREKYTSKGTPWILVWKTKTTTKAQAYSLERKLKNLSAERTIKFILKYSGDIAGPDALHLLEQWSRC